MPADYPGLYWNEERSRYFPISSRPRPPPSTALSLSNNVDTDTKLAQTLSRPKHRHPWHTHLSRVSTSCYTRSMRSSHEVLCFHYSNTSSCHTERISTQYPARVFHSAHIGGETRQFVGDDEGWLFSRRGINSEHISSCNWSPEPFIAPKPISSISTTDTHCVVTCHGPGKVFVQNIFQPENMFLLNFTSIHDIWTSSLRGPTLVLGANKKAAYLADIDQTRKPENLVTNSDVFSIAQENALVYAGTRSGSVHRFDMRTPKHQNQKLFNNRFASNPRRSVLHLDVIRGYEFFMSHMNGNLAVYDLRFASETSSAPPIRVFEGHVNDYTRNLGITIDKERDLLYAAGQDCRLRAWSLRTGDPLTPLPHPQPLPQHPHAQAQAQAQASPPHLQSDRAVVKQNQDQANPFLDTFPDPLHTLRVADEEEVGGGVTLWAASKREVYRYRLGQR